VLLLQWSLWFENANPVDPGIPMDKFRGNRFAHHWLLAAAKNGQFGLARKVAHHPCIALRQIEWNIPRNRRDTEDIELLGR